MALSDFVIDLVWFAISTGILTVFVLLSSWLDGKSTKPQVILGVLSLMKSRQSACLIPPGVSAVCVLLSALTC